MCSAADGDGITVGKSQSASTKKVTALAVQKTTKLRDLRRAYHNRLCDEVIWIRKRGDKEYPNFANGSSTLSMDVARGIVERMNYAANYESISRRKTSDRFKKATRDFLSETFKTLAHLRPGNWEHLTKHTKIWKFNQYAHVKRLESTVRVYDRLASAFGPDYIISPDIVIARTPVEDTEINRFQNVVDKHSSIANYTPFRAANHSFPHPAKHTHSGSLLHAAISCKWTLTSSHSHNTHAEALNLLRNRKGYSPHLVAVTAEPTPTRLAALTLGTGDLDCIYHVALPELRGALPRSQDKDQAELLGMMVNQDRLRDISDLPFDLIA